jgi:hypothetical protein
MHVNEETVEDKLRTFSRNYLLKCRKATKNSATVARLRFETLE